MTRTAWQRRNQRALQTIPLRMFTIVCCFTTMFALMGGLAGCSGAVPLLGAGAGSGDPVTLVLGVGAALAGVVGTILILPAAAGSAWGLWRIVVAEREREQAYIREVMEEGHAAD